LPQTMCGCRPFALTVVATAFPSGHTHKVSRQGAMG
jgi:hypothetical protein